MTKKAKFVILTIITFGVLTIISNSYEPRIWTRSDGKKAAGTLVEFKNEEAKIKFGEREIVLKLEDISPKDRAYLLEITAPISSSRFLHTQPDRGVCQKYIDFGERKLPNQGKINDQITRETLTKMIKENPDRKIYWLLTHDWIQGNRGKHINHIKLIYLKETKELIWMHRQELDFESPQNHVRWHEWAHWKNIEPSAWQKEIPFEVNEFKSDYDPTTARSTFNLSNPDIPELMEWP